MGQTYLMYGFLQIRTFPYDLELVPYEHIGIVTVRHHALQLRIANKVRQHITTTGAVLVKEDHCTPGLVH